MLINLVSDGSGDEAFGAREHQAVLAVVGAISDQILALESG